MAAHLYESLRPKSNYYDKRSKLSPEEYQEKLMRSSTIYVGNLSFYTREESLYELFSRCGEIKVLKMGLNKKEKKPCGFCFVEFGTHEDACYAVDCLNGTQIDERQIRIDWDIGFSEERQFGRGKSGGQIRDDHRTYEDPGRVLSNKPSFNRNDRPYNERRGGDDRHDFRRDDRRFNNNRRDDRRDDRRDYRGGDRRDDRREDRRADEGVSRNKGGESDSDVEEQNYRRKRVKE
mmetsp:Transcript_12744/g.14634  ORF Transcript_12744/g.14634 Transcript_12744/m.14634 type:complete len:234 (+) Transcript_12744:31-732(+)